MTDNSLFRDLRHRSAMGGGPDTAGERRVVWERSYYGALKGAGESLSGTGSSLVQTQVARARLDGLLGRIGAASILDAPCGDHHWMSHVGLAASYVGVDIVPELIERNRRQYPGRKFLLADIVSDDLPPADLILCRDALVHYSFGMALEMRCSERNGLYRDKSLGLWRFTDLVLEDGIGPAPR
jgi:hypothetical protein